MSTQLTVAEQRTTLDLATAFAKAKMVPAHYKDSPGDCYIAINLANRFGMDPWSVMQELYIIQGRPMMSGKMAIAILNHSLADPLRPEYAGAGDDREITLSGRPEGEAGPLTVTMKVRDAKTENLQWQKNPDQMLMYAASRMWGRRYTPDVLLGIVFDDEDVSDAPLVPKAPTTALGGPGSPDHTLARKTAAPEVIDPETGEVLDHPVALAKVPTEKWYDWGARLVSCMRGAAEIDTVDAWLAANADTLAECEKEAPKVHGNLIKAVNELKLGLVNRESAGA